MQRGVAGDCCSGVGVEVEVEWRGWGYGEDYAVEELCVVSMIMKFIYFLSFDFH